MMELAKRICRMPEEQLEELQQMIMDNYTDDIQMISDEGKKKKGICYYKYSVIHLKRKIK